MHGYHDYCNMTDVLEPLKAVVRCRLHIGLATQLHKDIVDSDANVLNPTKDTFCILTRCAFSCLCPAVPFVLRTSTVRRSDT